MTISKAEYGRQARTQGGGRAQGQSQRDSIKAVCDRLLLGLFETAHMFRVGMGMGELGWEVGGL